MSDIWIEKYRPLCLDDVAHHEHIKKMLMRILDGAEMPNLLLYGPPGTGKTSIIHAFAKELYGSSWKQNLLELNASDERGIDVVREHMKNWSKLINVNKNAKENCTKYKILLLDEADMMTTDAQNALRRIMEDTYVNTRFVLLCNYIHKIILPLISRCVVWRLNTLSIESQLTCLKSICHKEHVNITTDELNQIIKLSNSDLRRATNILQNYHFIKSYSDQPIDLDDFCGIPPQAVVTSIINTFTQQINDIINIYNEIINNGYHINNIFVGLINIIFHSDKLNEHQISKLTFSCLNSCKRMSQKSNGKIELLQFLLNCYHVYNKN